MVRKCKLCEYWQVSEANPGSGACHRQSPAVTDTEGCTWPQTAAEDWCGEYRFKNSAPSTIRPACRLCEFWVAVEDDPQGQCRRNGPAPGQASLAHPTTCADSWCGQFHVRAGKLAVGLDPCPVEG